MILYREVGTCSSHSGYDNADVSKLQSPDTGMTKTFWSESTFDVGIGALYTNRRMPERWLLNIDSSEILAASMEQGLLFLMVWF